MLTQQRQRPTLCRNPSNSASKSKTISCQQTCRERIGGLLLHRLDGAPPDFLRSFHHSLSVMMMSPHALTLPSAGVLAP